MWTAGIKMFMLVEQSPVFLVQLSQGDGVCLSLDLLRNFKPQPPTSFGLVQGMCSFTTMAAISKLVGALVSNKLLAW